ncbi:MAG: hypothetical protein A2402_00720 [Candidatus Staskawiczbacteria bacterium RIFOXYC1_FULL_37_43]|nr:MAG: hypothetical protein A2813_01610 [Candidatus Staskawiczbacteria bacterium RIFCSPHIGHO2_01_FULL_37_17]OGZ71463.1 MAG: hypothetical protein A2891_00945 [Candidatus Staskawiczbacteria bacterium RIFCSPLOWO2_01_FULL_37_19]OGZ76144.1 MAG: hypothetical protein A2205_03790 [Candidatus Staskawiczbacteria bacterium RIFOXYA1_FULL_37_15]OGZ77481.1 MAG: hypothetical protein A2280_02965 [Candidatus Staskawiczbacteria bacterium RIFOXYA12_FULL_37_10]OGZ80112.1 MAG: hypothetical protein A2353_02510 [Can
MQEKFESNTHSEPEQLESAEKRNERMAMGNITNEEILEYLNHPEDVLFSHKLVSEKKGEKIETDIKVRALTKDFLEPTLESLKNSWDDVSFENLRETLTAYFEQKETGKPGLLNVEYYIATDQEDKPLAMTGLYTIDIQGGAGFSTKNHLDTEKHNLNMGLGWYSVSKEAQGTGLGKYFLDWTENLAKTRGAKHFEVETDDWSVSEKAVKMYQKSGYKEGFPVKDFYGPRRDLNVYYCDCSKEKDAEQTVEPAEITEENKEKIIQIAKENYSPERFEEFMACLDLFLQQDKGSGAIFTGHSAVFTDSSGQPESFAIYVDGIYDNCSLVYWLGANGKDASAKANLLSGIKSISKGNDKDILMIYNENEDEGLRAGGFKKAKHGVPGVFGKGDKTKFLLFTKLLN